MLDELPRKMERGTPDTPPSAPSPPSMPPRFAVPLPLLLPLLLLALLLGDASAPARADAQPAPPRWTHGATCYEVFVRSFRDSDGDGIGDLRGLMEKLDYINDGRRDSPHSLGARCVWLMPVAESPSYHGYDVTDYYRVDREYGTNADFRAFVAAAHRRGIRVLVDLVLNHSSSEHPYFQAALRDTASPYRAWYRWSPTPSRPAELNPWGQSNWHRSPVRDEWYYGFFWSGMPDLNYRTPAVRAEARKMARFWLREMGVDGFRLDAVSYLVEEPGRIAHTRGTHAVLRAFQADVRALRPDAFTIGEVTGTLDDLRGYYPDQLDAYFGFEVADSIVAALRSGSAAALLPTLAHAVRTLPVARWSPFVGNHDQPRPVTKLGGDRAAARLAAFLVLTLPGMPFIYYGDEIGMQGDKPDERLRTPMQWTAGPGAGFTRGTPWERPQDDSATVTVAAQDRDSSSLLAFHRRLIQLRSRNIALARGRLIPLAASDPGVVAYVRRRGNRAVLVIANVAAAPAVAVTLAAPPGTLPPGRWRLRSLLSGADAAPLVVEQDGAVRRYLARETVGAREGVLYELVPAPPRTSTR